MTKKGEPSIDHLSWLIEARAKNNKTGLKLLSLFHDYPAEIRKHLYIDEAQELVAIAFSLWRAAFLADRKGLKEERLIDAESFLRKVLVDNQIGFTQDRLWREWAFNYYLDDALFRLKNLEDQWAEGGFVLWSGLRPPKGKRTSKNRWDRLHAAFAKAVDFLAKDLEDASYG